MRDRDRARGIRGVVLAGLLLCGLAQALTLPGDPPVARHSPDLEVYPQNFAIAQDRSGVVYVGATEGVLEFDGERWGLLELPNGEIVRSLAVDDDDRVLVGGYDRFGHLQRNAAGELGFVDLTSRFAGELDGRSFADVWDVLPTPEGVYFRALRDVFFWDPASGATAHWHYPERFGAIAHDDGRTLLQFRGEGFRYRDGEHWIPLPDTAALTDLVFALLPLADGGLATLGSDGGWWRLRDGAAEPLPMPDDLPSSSGFENAIALDDGSLVLASGSGELVIVDPQRSSTRRFQLDPGFLSGVHPAIDGGLLVSADEAIYHVVWPSPWSGLNAGDGLSGSLMALSEWNDALYLLGSAGVARLQVADGFRLEPQPWGTALAMDLLAIDPDRALLAESHHLQLVHRDGSRELLDAGSYPRQFWHSRYHDARIWVGTEHGLRQIDVSGAQPVLSPRDPSGLDMRVSSLVETGARELWCGTERNGLWRVALDDDGRIDSMQRVDAAQGIRYGKVNYASVTQLADGAVAALTGAGIHRLEGGRFVATSLGGLDQHVDPARLVGLHQASDGVLWAWSPRRLWRRPPGESWQEQPIASLQRGGLGRVGTLRDGATYVLASHALLVHDDSLQAPALEPPGVALRSVTRIDADGSHLALPLDPGQPLVVDQGDFGVRFEFALPDLAHVATAQYQGRLVGYEAEFSAWSRSRGYTYWRLRPGEYRLEVRARDAHGHISRIDPWRLVVDPPWYRSPWALALWVALGVALLWLLFQRAIGARTRRLAQETALLEAQVAERTRDLETANHRLRLMANLDGLTGIANRRRLDEYLERVWQHHRARGRPMSVLAIDVDHFKRYNDSNGHLAGDQYLKDLATRLTQCLRRAEDLLARYGGEEFLVVMPGAESARAAEVAESMRADIETAGLGATVSIGVATRIPDRGSYDGLLEAADAALYRAKRDGRNRVVVDGDVHPRSQPPGPVA